MELNAVSFDQPELAEARGAEPRPHHTAPTRAGRSSVERACDDGKAPLRSCFYECSVMHHRLSPREHAFRHQIFMLALDLDELGEVARHVRGFSHNRRNVYEFRDRDHLTLPEMGPAPLKSHLLTWISRQGMPMPSNPDAVRVTLLTLPRVAGYLFNPVSFYFVADAVTDRPLCAVVEVGNTFGELKPYLVPIVAPDGFLRLVAPKHFYVSPFSRLDFQFDFQLRVPGERLHLRVDEFDGSTPILLSALTGRRRPLTTARLWAATALCPLVTLKVILLIHWQAFWLWIKRVPWDAKAGRPDLQRDVFRPHASLNRPQP